MKTVIYADVLVIINLIVNYLLLRATSSITGYGFKAWRLLVSSTVGALFSMIIFIENIPFSVNFFIKIIFSSIMVIIAFGNKNIKSFLKCSGVFFLVNFAFAGIMLAICTTLKPSAAIYKNGIVYFDISIITLTVSTIICYVIITFITKLTKSKIPQKSIYSVRIHYGGNVAECKALLDSGNTLCDCFSGKPVIITENSIVSDLCTDDITTMRNFRLIPFSTIKDSGVLPAFLADKAEIAINGKWFKNNETYIAVTQKKIVSGEYSALFGMPFLETVEAQLKGETIKL